jgi:hypothetical protein
MEPSADFFEFCAREELTEHAQKLLESPYGHAQVMNGLSIVCGRGSIQLVDQSIEKSRALVDRVFPYHDHDRALVTLIARL